MDMKQLRYFTAICEEGSISAAAKKLYVSQPPVSTQMKLLESELGTRLFERGAKNIRLTEAGMSFYKRAVTILELCSVAQEEAGGYGRGYHACIHVGVVSSLVSRVTGEWLTDFCAEFPDSRFEVTEGNTYQLLEKLSTDLLHFALVRTPFTSPGMISELLQEERILAVSEPEYFANDKNEICMRELVQHPLILYRRWEKLVRDAFDEKQLALKCILICDDARTALNAAASGVGIAVVPASAVMSGDLQTMDIPDLQLRSGIVMIHRKDVELSEAAKSYMEYITEKYRHAK